MSIPSFCRAVFSGSRSWLDEVAPRLVIDALPADAVVIHGDCNRDLFDRTGQRVGLDMIVDGLARARGLRVLAIPAAWTEHAPGWCRCRPGMARPSSCKGAGPRRNQRLIDEARPTQGYAFPLPSSTGTWDMVDRLFAARIPYRVWTPDGWREQMRRPGR